MSLSGTPRPPTGPPPKRLRDVLLDLPLQIRLSEIAIDVVEHPVCPDFEYHPLARRSAQQIDTTERVEQANSSQGRSGSSDRRVRRMARELVSCSLGMCHP